MSLMFLDFFIISWIKFESFFNSNSLGEKSSYSSKCLNYQILSVLFFLLVHTHVTELTLLGHISVLSSEYSEEKLIKKWMKRL